MSFHVKVTGIPEAARKLDAKALEPGLRRGLQRAGDVVAGRAKSLVRPHHYTGRFEREIHTEIRGSGLELEAFVGVHSGMVPEARPVSYGWKSGSGRQPPTQAIAEWLVHKPEIANSPLVTRGGDGFVKRSGTISQVTADRNIRSMAFLIARKIGKSGYSFAPVRPFERAVRWATSQAGGLGAIIAREIERGWRG